MALEEFFVDKKFSIAEPLFLTEIYKKLNSLDGVEDTISIEIVNKYGDVYSNVFLDLDDMLKSGEKILEIPKNAILELKYPQYDIEGVIK